MDCGAAGEAMTRNRPYADVSQEDAAFVRGLVLHDDAHILVFNKPSGLAVQGGNGVTRSLDVLLGAFAKSNGKTPKLVHRLDQGTSGVIVVARTQPAAAHLSAQFEGRETEKTYVALVSGRVPEADAGVIDQALAKVEEGGRARMLIAKPGRKGAQRAVTRWRVVARGEAAALLELTPETGRMHQIRAHLMHLGCPILGDALYGDGRARVPRLMLHARALAFEHPAGGRVRFEAAVPEDFETARLAFGV